MSILEPSSSSPLWQLATVQLRALALACEDMGRSPEEWPDIPALRVGVEAVAAARCVADYRGAGHTLRDALDLAAGDLGMSRHTLSSKLRAAGVKISHQRDRRASI